MASTESKFDAEASRGKAMAESFDVAKKQKHGMKHGMFQMATTTALGDTTKFPKTTHARDPDTGKPQTQPRNFYTTKIKTGKSDEVYIGADKRDFKKKMPETAKERYTQQSTYIAMNNPYDQSAQLHAGKRTFVKNGYAQMGGHETDFRPAKQVTHNKKDTLASVKYMEQGPPPKKQYKDEEGNVKFEPPNFLTNPMKKGVMHGKKGQRGPFFDHPGENGNKYVESDYNIEKKILREELAEHQSKLQEQPFYPLARQLKGDSKKFYFGTFNNPKVVIGPIGDKELPAKKVEAPQPNIHDEDPPFRPYGTNTNNKRVHDTFDKFPGCQMGAIKETKRKPPPPDDAPPPFKQTHNVKHLPITSIQTNPRNLKASYPQFFRR